MTLQELLEHAHLDALGQLDEREQAAFEAAFAVAPPAIKAQVRHEQARWSPMEHLLPQVEPSPELRGRVLDAVTAAMVAQGAGELSMRPSRRVAPAWRAASIGLMTAVVVLGAALVYVDQTNDKSAATQRNGNNMDFVMLAFKGNSRSAMMDPQTVRTVFSAVDPQGTGAIWTNESWNLSYAFIELPKNAEKQEYRIVSLDAAGKVDKVLTTFTSTGQFQTFELPKFKAGTQLAVVSARSGSQPNAIEATLLTAQV